MKIGYGLLSLALVASYGQVAVAGLEPSPFRWAAVWGADDSQVWAVGERGTIARFNGKTWDVVATPTEKNLTQISGTSGKDIWAVGAGVVLHYDGITWKMGVEPSPFLDAIWGYRANDVWSVGEKGTCWHFDGKSWSSIAIGTSEALTGIWGSSASDVWVVGGGGTVAHYDGRLWRAGVEPSPFLEAIWGSAANDVWAVGASGSSLHFNGQKWESVATGVSADLNEVSGSARDNAWVVGTEGTLLRWRGRAWERVTSGTTQSLNGLWVSRAGKLYVVGDNVAGTIEQK